MADALEELLAGCKMSIYNESKWRGVEDALGEYCLLGAIGGIGSETFRRWRAIVAPKSSASKDENQRTCTWQH